MVVATGSLSAPLPASAGRVLRAPASAKNARTARSSRRSGRQASDTVALRPGLSRPTARSRGSRTSSLANTVPTPSPASTASRTASREPSSSAIRGASPSRVIACSRSARVAEPGSRRINGAAASSASPIRRRRAKPCPRGHEGDDPVLVERLSVQRRVGLDQVEHREVGPRRVQLGQHAGGIADPHGDPHPRVARDEARDQVHHRERAVGADLEAAGLELAGGRQQRLEIVELGEHAARALPQLAAEVGELDAVAEAAEQQRAVALLERAHLRRDRRLADADARRPTGEAAGARDRVERAELGKAHNLHLSSHHEHAFAL